MARPMATRWRWPPESCARLAVEIVGEIERRRGLGHLLRRSRPSAGPPSSGRRRCCCARSYADRARRTGTPWRGRACDGGTSATSTPSIMISPPLASSSPAIRRSSVDLPQPDGPTKTTNSPLLMARLAPGMMTTSPKLFCTFLSAIVPIQSRSFHRSECEAADKLFLREPAEHQDRRDGHGRSGRELGPEQAFRARIGGDELRSAAPHPMSSG